jgi:hypothetical protein
VEKVGRHEERCGAVQESPVGFLQSREACQESHGSFQQSREAIHGSTIAP